MKPFITTRSAHSALMTCRRLRYLNYHVGGRGVVPAAMNPALGFGTFTHRLLAEGLRQPLDYDLLGYAEQEMAAEAALWQLGGMEQNQAPLWLAAALAAVWQERHLPLILRDYEVISVEDEWLLNLPAASQFIGNKIQLPYRIDAVLRHRGDGSLVPLDFKTISYAKDEALRAYDYDMQTLLHTWATEVHFGEPCSRVMLHFLYKGSNRNGVYYSPLVTGYRKAAAPPFVEEQVSWEYRANWARFNTWEYPGGLRAWLRRLPESVLASQVLTREVYRHADVDNFVRQFAVQEDQVADALLALDEADSEEMRNLVMDSVFPGNLDSTCWHNRFGQRCAYVSLCFEGKTVEEALASGEFGRRVPHSAAELAAVTAEEEKK